MYFSAGESAGDVVTTVVYSIAPSASRRETSAEIVEFFCPIAT
jgi:hypothetical protein